jgi:hypothetical protein
MSTKNRRKMNEKILSRLLDAELMARLESAQFGTNDRESEAIKRKIRSFVETWIRIPLSLAIDEITGRERS